MNRRCYLSAVPALVVAAVVFAPAEANATVPEEPAAVVPHDPGPPSYPSYDIPIQTTTDAGTSGPSDDTAAEVLQTSAAALGGAGIAIAGTWLYRRRQAHIA